MKVNGYVIGSWTDLIRADLQGADLRRADLQGADLQGASLQGADLQGASLQGADLRRADLQGADLRGGNLAGCRVNYYTIGYFNIPQNTDLIGFKEVNGIVIKLLIPKEAKRSCATTRKCRAEYAEVVEIYSDKSSIKNIIYNTLYKEGQRVYPDKFDDNRWNECSNGIHFFLTLEEAKG